jgi:hypothetical protein
VQPNEATGYFTMGSSTVQSKRRRRAGERGILALSNFVNSTDFNTRWYLQGSTLGMNGIRMERMKRSHQKLYEAGQHESM